MPPAIFAHSQADAMLPSFPLLRAGSPIRFRPFHSTGNGDHVTWDEYGRADAWIAGQGTARRSSGSYPIEKIPDRAEAWSPCMPAAGANSGRLRRPVTENARRRSNAPREHGLADPSTTEARRTAYSRTRPDDVSGRRIERSPLLAGDSATPAGGRSRHRNRHQRRLRRRNRRNTAASLLPPSKAAPAILHHYPSLSSLSESDNGRGENGNRDMHRSSAGIPLRTEITFTSGTRTITSRLNHRSMVPSEVERGAPAHISEYRGARPQFRRASPTVSGKTSERVDLPKKPGCFDHPVPPQQIQDADRSH